MGEERSQPRRCGSRTIRGLGWVVRNYAAGQGRFGSSLQIRHSLVVDARDVRARRVRRTGRSLCRYVAGPQLHHVAVRISHVRRSLTWRRRVVTEIDLVYLYAVRPDLSYSSVIVGFCDRHGEMHVHAAPRTGDADLRLPKPDPGLVSGLQPNRFSAAERSSLPTAHDRQPEHVTVEPLGGFQVAGFEHELGHAHRRNRHLHPPRLGGVHS